MSSFSKLFPQIKATQNTKKNEYSYATEQKIETQS